MKKILSLCILGSSMLFCGCGNNNFDINKISSFSDYKGTNIDSKTLSVQNVTKINFNSMDKDISEIRSMIQNISLDSSAEDISKKINHLNNFSYCAINLNNYCTKIKEELKSQYNELLFIDSEITNNKSEINNQDNKIIKYLINNIYKNYNKLSLVDKDIENTYTNIINLKNNISENIDELNCNFLILNNSLDCQLAITSNILNCLNNICAILYKYYDLQDNFTTNPDNLQDINTDKNSEKAIKTSANIYGGYNMPYGGYPVPYGNYNMPIYGGYMGMPAMGYGGYGFGGYGGYGGYYPGFNMFGTIRNIDTYRPFANLNEIYNYNTPNYYPENKDYEYNFLTKKGLIKNIDTYKDINTQHINTYKHAKKPIENNKRDSDDDTLNDYDLLPNPQKNFKSSNKIKNHEYKHKKIQYESILKKLDFLNNLFDNDTDLIKDLSPKKQEDYNKDNLLINISENTNQTNETNKKIIDNKNSNIDANIDFNKNKENNLNNKKNTGINQEDNIQKENNEKFDNIITDYDNLDLNYNIPDEQDIIMIDDIVESINDSDIQNSSKTNYLKNKENTPTTIPEYNDEVIIKS